MDAIANELPVDSYSFVVTVIKRFTTLEEATTFIAAHVTGPHDTAGIVTAEVFDAPESPDGAPHT